MPAKLDLTAFDARVTAEFAALCEAVHALPLPEGHAWRKPRGELSWFAGSVLESSRYGASCHAGLLQDDDHDPRQIDIEVRWFWRREADTPERFAISHDQCRAHLFCTQGERFWGKNRTLLVNDEPFMKADSLPALIEIIGATLTRALARAEPVRAPVPVTEAA